MHFIDKSIIFTFTQMNRIYTNKYMILENEV